MAYLPSVALSHSHKDKVTAMALSDDTDSLAFVRSMLPDANSGDPGYVSNTQLDYLYANIANSDVNETIAWALRQMCIKLSNKVQRTNTATGDTVAAQQEREAVCKEAVRWANIAGINTGQVGTVTIGTINLGIDEEDSEFNIT
jgi:hypothetical protein